MEFLKDVFGDGALTYGELAEKLRDNRDVKLGNLAGGRYVQREKLTALEAERDALKARLGELEGLDAQGAQKAAAEWEARYRADTQALRDELAAQAYGHAAQEAAAGLQFSSASARRAFLAELTARKLPLEEGRLDGFDAFVSAYRAGDPEAFAPEGGLPRLVTGSGGKPPAAAVTREEYAAMGYGERLRLKTEQPELYRELAAR
ncbi:hypothetical protein LI291_10120 [Intestinibacillus massiliensis]|nr:hypothetical protein [Intestinibacillus massiliensis]